MAALLKIVMGLALVHFSKILAVKVIRPSLSNGAWSKSSISSISKDNLGLGIHSVSVYTIENLSNLKK